MGKWMTTSTGAMEKYKFFGGGFHLYVFLPGCSDFVAHNPQALLSVIEQGNTFLDPFQSAK